MRLCFSKIESVPDNRLSGFPCGLKMGGHFPVREKSGNLEQTGKGQGKSDNILENSRNLRQMLFIIFNNI